MTSTTPILRSGGAGGSEGPQPSNETTTPKKPIAMQLLLDE
jgi:hypothetical protein